MTLPGPIEKQLDATSPRTLPTDTGVWFIAALTEKGPTDQPTLIQSPQAYAKTYGGRGNGAEYALAADSIEVAFKGVTKVYVQRFVGPAATKASHDFVDGSAAVSLHITAKNEGAWGNSLTVRILDHTDNADISVGSIQIQVADSTGTLETSSSFATQADAVAWASENVTVTAGVATDLPVKVAATALSGGADDRASVTDAQRTAALAKFTRDLGPGQVSIPGATSDAVHTALASHGVANNRRPLYDLPDTSDVSTLKTALAWIRSLDQDSRRVGQALAPWGVIPGLTPNTTRKVPYSAVQAALIARLDSKFGNPNLPAAGENGIAEFLLGVTQTWNDADRETLNDAGVTVAKLVAGQVRTYGLRSTADKDVDTLHWQFANVRLDMAIAAEGNVVAESEEFKQLDGKGTELAKYAGKLVGVCLGFYGKGALYGDTPDQAFRVDVGPSVNTPDVIAEGKPKAVLSLVRSPGAEAVELDIIRVPVGQSA